MNQTEIDELRERIDAAISTVCNGMAAMSIPADPRDVDLVLADCAKALAALADAEAERSEARSLLLNGIQTNGDSLAFLEHVRREHAAVVAERDALNAKLAHAEAESAGYQKLAQACKDKDGKTVVVIIRGESEVRVFGPNPDCEERFGEVVVRWWKLLDTVVESKAFDALKAERDALKATLSKHAESERAWCELATERGAKMAALVEATAEVHEKLRINADGKATVTVGKAIALRRELGEALAAAKVQP